MDYLFLAARVLFGGYFIMNGFNHLKNMSGMVGYAQSKNVPFPKLAIIGTGIILLLGGLGIVLGVFVNLAVVLLSIFLIGVTYKMHQFWKVTDPMIRMGEYINFTKNIALLGATIAFLFISSWPFSL